VTRVRTPLWVRAPLLLALVALSAWLIAVHLERVGNEHRLSAIASQIAGRPVKVHCPGIVERKLFAPDTVEGTVQFGADGKPSDTTDLRATPCAELDALAEGRRAAVLRCVSCGGAAAEQLAWSVDVLTHESFHLAGISAEAITECRAMARMAWTAQQLGATAEQAAELADLERRATYPRMPDAYRMDCSTLAPDGAGGGS
jgi:hypothetical protein